MNIKTTPKVYALVLNYNGKKFLSTCLDSLYKSDFPNLEVVVIDNNSKDGSFEDARLKFPRFHFIKNSENLGFAAGNNVAIRFALEKMADYIFLLNNDATIEPDTLAKLVAIAEEKSSRGIISPVILSWEKTAVWFAGGDIDWKKMKTFHHTKIKSPAPYQTNYISGCAMLIKKNVFKKIGLFDEKFFLYYEDADLSHRAFKAGFDLIIEPSAIAYHAEKSNDTNSAKLYWLVLSGLVFFKKNTPNKLRLWMFFYLTLRKVKNFLDIYVKKNTSPQIMEIRRAYKDYKKLF